MDIPLTQGKFAIIDDEDYEKIKERSWQLHRGKYARGFLGKAPRNPIFMHRLILGLSKNDDVYVDHINGDGLDNRKVNLRLCSTTQNQQNSSVHQNNSSKYKGVHWYKRNKKWGVHIRVNKQLLFLGLFDDEKDAAIVYNNAAIKYFGKFARLNDVT